MGIELNTETTDQFLARMLIAVREGHQIVQHDAQRLSDLAQYGPGPVPPTMAEERREPIRRVEPGETYPVVH